METKIIYFDIDGTLRDENSGVSEKTKYMIDECKKQDIKTMICTGRNPGSIQQDVLDLHMDGAIYSGGCYITFQDSVIQKTAMSKEIVDKIFEKKIFAIAVETQTTVYMNQSAAKIYQKLFLEKTKGLDKIERKKIKTENKFLYENNIKDFDAEKEDVYKICFIDHKEKLEQMQEEMKQACSIAQLVPFADRWILECIPPGCDKGKAINILNEHLGIRTEESMAFGDGENDIEMLQAAGTGIAMKSGSKKLLETADVICDSVKQDGIYKELVKRKLIKEKR